MRLRSNSLIFVIVLFAPLLLAKSAPRSNPNHAIDRIFEREHVLAATLRNYSPVVETYLQLKH